jgi:hypothetical protein
MLVVAHHAGAGDVVTPRVRTSATPSLREITPVETMRPDVDEFRAVLVEVA